jgi:hypothetical protein
VAVGVAGGLVAGVVVEGEPAVGDLDTAVGSLAVAHQVGVDSLSRHRIAVEGWPGLGAGIEAGRGAVGVEGEAVECHSPVIDEVGPVLRQL